MTKNELLSKKEGKMKLGLQIILGILSLIPAIVSILGITQGAVRFIPDSVTVDFDSHYRYLTGYYLSLSLLVWWIIPQIEKHKTLLRIICGGIFFGGIGRIISDPDWHTWLWGNCFYWFGVNVAIALYLAS